MWAEGSEQDGSCPATDTRARVRRRRVESQRRHAVLSLLLLLLGPARRPATRFFKAPSFWRMVVAYSLRVIRERERRIRKKSELFILLFDRLRRRRRRRRTEGFLWRVCARAEVSNVSNPAARPLLTSSPRPFIRPSRLKWEGGERFPARNNPRHIICRTRTDRGTCRGNRIKENTHKKLALFIITRESERHDTER